MKGKVEDKKKQKEIKGDWYVVDAKGIRLGILASKIAKILQGKNKAEYTPNVDFGDYVIVINSKLVDVHPSRYQRKKYYRHSGYPGGIKEISLGELTKKSPNDVIIEAVKGMMPKSKLGRKMLRKLYVYSDENHKHKSQKPSILKM